MSRKRLIVNADDLGFVESVNRGIIETIESGVVRSASLMVNMGAHEDAIARLRAARGRGIGDVSIGLHFNIVTGRPLAACPTLVDQKSGTFHSIWRIAADAFTGRIDPLDVERELAAQLERATTLLLPLGLRVTHLDSHRHAHALPVVFDGVTSMARRHGIAHVRHVHPSPAALLGRVPATAATRLLRLALPRRAESDAIRFAGLALMRSRTLDRDLARLLAELPDGTTELMVHPGYDSPELAALDRYRAPRERELRALTAPALRSRIRDLGMELTHFGATARFA